MPAATDRVAAVRAFNRFYTRRIGVLHEGLLHSGFSLTESRLLWELAQRTTTTASDLGAELDLDSGYLSRLLRGFRERGLLRTTRSTADARRVLLALTAAGRRAFAPLDARSQQEVAALLEALPDGEQQSLLQAMHRIERTLRDAPAGKAPFLLRMHGPGDIGWITSRHGALYASEYGWDTSFEALVGHIGSRFIEQFDPKRECCWIAEREGVNIGSVVLVQARDEPTNAPVAGVAQLRLLLVEPAARGMHIGDALVRECERFARRTGYRTIRLWTNRNLVAARALYVKAGYRLVASAPHRSFGHDLIGETWDLALD